MAEFPATLADVAMRTYRLSCRMSMHQPLSEGWLKGKAAKLLADVNRQKALPSGGTCTVGSVTVSESWPEWGSSRLFQCTLIQGPSGSSASLGSRCQIPK